VSASGPAVALVFSPEAWVEELHRHVSHHGGARVRQIVVEPSVALDEDYDVLVVSDRWPALTHGLVRAVHERGRGVLGVFDPEEPAGKDHLVDLGVDATIAADADVTEFVAALRDLQVAVGYDPGDGGRPGP
jgi:methylmalonyl-CoA mutase cobalamin-binding subunit